MLRRVLTVVAFAAILASRIDPLLLQFPFHDRAALRYLYDELYADRTWRQYPQFMRGVAAHTQKGETIAVIVPIADWDRGYSYAFYRASYLLAGREVLPLLDRENHFHPENLQRAELVAAWRTRVPPTHGKVVWSGDGGVLVRR